MPKVNKHHNSVWREGSTVHIGRHPVNLIHTHYPLHH